MRGGEALSKPVPRSSVFSPLTAVVTPLAVLGSGHGLDVVGVATARVAAQVIRLKTTAPKVQVLKVQVVNSGYAGRNAKHRDDMRRHRDCAFEPRDIEFQARVSVAASHLQRRIPAA